MHHSNPHGINITTISTNTTIPTQDCYIFLIMRHYFITPNKPSGSPVSYEIFWLLADTGEPSLYKQHLNFLLLRPMVSDKQSAKFKTWKAVWPVKSEKDILRILQPREVAPFQNIQTTFLVVSIEGFCQWGSCFTPIRPSTSFNTSQIHFQHC